MRDLSIFMAADVFCLRQRMVEPCYQVISLVKAESQVQSYLEEDWGCNNGSTDPHPYCCVIEILLKGHHMLSLGGVFQCLPY